MNQPANGNGVNLDAPPDVAPAKTEPVHIPPDKAMTMLEQQVDPIVRQIVGNTIRGLLVSCPGVPPHILLNSIARQTGSLLAGAFTADLATTLSMRKGLKDAFGNAIAKEKIVQPPMPQPKPMTRG